MINFQNRQMKLPDGSLAMVCRIIGSIDGSTLPRFEKKMLGFLDEGFKYLILVFSEVKYINSTGMGVLVKLADMYQEAGGEVSLVDVPDKLVALLNILGLLALIKLASSEEEALQQFKEHKNTAGQDILQNDKISVSSESKVLESSKSVLRPSENRSSESKASLNKSGIQAPESKASLNKNVVKPENKASLNKSAIRPPENDKFQSKTQIQTIEKEKTASISGIPVSNTSSSINVKQTPETKKILLVHCQECKTKISLGATLKLGTYKCPRCMAMFKILPSGKIEFVKKT